MVAPSLAEPGTQTVRPEIGSGPEERSAQPGRDPLVDALRATALVRVVLWHAFAAAWLSWVFPAMPVMFFLAGSLLATSASSSTWGALLARRAKRLLVPFWGYGLVVGAVTLQAAQHDGTLHLLTAREGWSWQALSWVLPLVDPVGTAAQEGWLSSHLWYVRGYLWLLLLAPLVLVVARRPLLAATGALTGLVALELGHLWGLGTLEGVGRLATGDLLCYGLFAVLGAAWTRRQLDGRSSGPWWALGPVGLALVGAGLWGGHVLGPVDGSLNSSYLLLAVSGLGWLALVGAAEGTLRRVSGTATVWAVSRWFTARAVTIYLWHPAAIVLARAAVPGNDLSAAVQILALTAALTLGAVLAFGWLEDVAAGRPARLWPGRRIRLQVPWMLQGGATAATAGGLVVVLAATFAGGLGGTLAHMPGPSDRSALDNSAFAQNAQEEEFLVFRAEPLAALPGDKLQAVLEAWVQVNPDVGSVTASVVSGDVTWTGSASSDGKAQVNDKTEIMSLTKSLTAALVLQEVAAGRISLDSPMPPIDGVAPVADGRAITPRQLLQHTSGLVQYTDAPGYDPERVYTAAELVSLSTQTPLQTEPGSQVLYNNSGYLWLGLLLEQVTQESYADLVEERLTKPLGLEGTIISPEERPGWVGFSSGGGLSTPEDVARWYAALVESDSVLDPEVRAEMLDLGEHNVGLGVWPLCPCGEEDGRKWSAGYGQVIWSGGAYDYPRERVSLYVRIDPGGDRAMELTPGLMETLRAALPKR